jgi:hypothetical protein
MGIRVSIDKHVSNLEELLEMSPSYFSKLKFESKVDQGIYQHLKVSLSKRLQNCQIWRFSEDKTKFDSVKITPVPLGHLKQNSFTFSPTEAYLVLVI